MRLGKVRVNCHFTKALHETNHESGLEAVEFLWDYRLLAPSAVVPPHSQSRSRNAGVLALRPSVETVRVGHRRLVVGNPRVRVVAVNFEGHSVRALDGVQPGSKGFSTGVSVEIMWAALRLQPFHREFRDGTMVRRPGVWCLGPLGEQIPASESSTARFEVEAVEWAFRTESRFQSCWITVRSNLPLPVSGNGLVPAFGTHADEVRFPGSGA